MVCGFLHWEKQTKINDLDWSLNSSKGFSYLEELCAENILFPSFENMETKKKNSHFLNRLEKKKKKSDGWRFLCLYSI